MYLEILGGTFFGNTFLKRELTVVQGCPHKLREICLRAHVYVQEFRHLPLYAKGARVNHCVLLSPVLTVVH